MRLRPFYAVPRKEWVLFDGTPLGGLPDGNLRQWILRELVDSYGYPPDWMGKRIVTEAQMPNVKHKQVAHVIVNNERGLPFLIIELSTTRRSETAFVQIVHQLADCVLKSYTAKLGMVTDGKKTTVVRVKTDSKDFDYISDIPEYDRGYAARPKLVRRDAENGRIRTTLQPISEKYENLLFEAHSAIRDIDGMHDDEALDELTKLIYAKIFDERIILEKHLGKAFRFQVNGASCASEAASNIRLLYDDARKKDLEVFAQRILGYVRSRGAFLADFRLSDVALARVTEFLQGYSILDSAIDIKGRAFQKVLRSAIRAGMGQYFTPEAVVRLAIEMIQPTPEDIILDPFCGSGHFLTKSLDFVLKRYGETFDPYSLHEFRFFKLHGIEKSDRMVRIAMTDMLLHDDGHSNIRNTDALLSFDNYPDILSMNGDRKKDPEVFTIVLTNPPFGSTIQKDARKMLGEFELGDRKKSTPLEILGLERSIQFLKPGGRIAIVLPDSVLSNQNTAHVREWLVKHCRIVGIVSLPVETFIPYGANHKTSLCVLRKWRLNEKSSNYRVFLARIDNIGYDATGRERGNSDIEAVARNFLSFIAKCGW